MKLVIQIPCYNEEKTLPACLRDLPENIEGIDIIETLVINDGSTDRTEEVARNQGADHIISFRGNKGLARAFSVGIEKCLELGADIIVNTDGDNQYLGKDIPKLIQPILEGKADVVVGSRPVQDITHFSWLKKMLNKYGSALVRRLSKTKVEDTVSGFRAYSREAALRINLITDFSHTLENLLQLGNQKMQIISVPVRTNKKTRESRLFKSSVQFLSSQLATMLRVYTTYKSLKVFITLGLFVSVPGVIGFVRFFWFYVKGQGQGHIQSLVFSSVFLIVGFILLVFGIIADLISSNRKLIEKALYKIKKMELEEKRDED